MRNCPPGCSVAIRTHRNRSGHIGTTCAPIISLVAAIALAFPSRALAQNMVMPPVEATAPVTDNGVAPMSQSGDVSFFSQDLGTVLRLRYSTESYGQDGQGNFDIGTMQVMSFDDSAAIFDGQVTMNDNNGVGFNVGAGYRWMNFPPYAIDTGRVDGIGIFADGMHTEAGNFFPQIGVSYESLGELWDMRGNLYVPVGKETQVGNFKPTGVIGFEGNSISELTRAIVDTSFTVGEIEIARRLGAERDAWAFAGPYFVANSDQSSAGGRVGVRGYAYPDLLLQFAVSQDDVFHTEATFSLQWFVGRTRTNFQPSGGVADRMREPFMRNDYVALSKSTREGGMALTNPDGTALRVVHVASAAAAGGNGSFEHPYNELDQADGAGSQKGDIIFAHSTSSFGTNIILQDNQRMLGEGNNKIFTVATKQEGTITIPESSPGARALARPMIVAAVGDAITLADNNEVANFDMDGQSITARAIASPATGAGNPNLHDLAIKNMTSGGIEFTPATITDPNNASGQIVRGNVTIDNVTLDNVGGNGIDINSDTTTNVTLPTVTLQEAIAISNVTSTGGTGRGINIENTHTGAGHTTTLTNYTYDGGTTSLGGVRLNNFDGSFNATNSTLTNGASLAAGGTGVQIVGDTDGTINFASTFVFNKVNGTSVDINGDVAGVDSINGNITIAGPITNDVGRSVSVQNVGTAGSTSASVVFSGDITDNGEGMIVNSNSGGNVSFIGDLAMTTTAGTTPATAISVTNNTGASVDFAGNVVINATDNGANVANGFVATGGGTISAPGTTNSITTQTGQALKITDMTIAAANVRFGDINRSVAGATTNAIQLENNTGLGTAPAVGAVIIGNTTDVAGDAGTIQGGTVDAIRIKDSANTSVTGLIVENGTQNVAGLHIEKSNTAAMNVDLGDITVNGGDTGVETVGGGTGALTMTADALALNGSQTNGMLFNNVDVTGATGIQVTGATIDGNNAGASANGVKILGSNGTITFDTATQISEFSGNDFEVDGDVGGSTGAITYNGTIENEKSVNPADISGHSLFIHRVSGGTVTIGTASTIKDDNEGMLVDSNTGGTFNIGSDNTLNTTTHDALVVTNNTGATTSLTGTNTINTTSGRGLVVTGGGTFSALDPANKITTTTGTGLDLEDVTIANTGVLLASVNVNGATNGIVMKNLTGGNVTIGSTGAAQNSAGSLTTTGDAVILQNTASVVIQHLQIVSAGGQGVNLDQTNGATTDMSVRFTDLNLDAALGTGFDVLGASNSHTLNLQLRDSDLEKNVAMNITGSGTFNMVTDSTDVNSTGTDIAFALSFGSAASIGNATFSNGNNFTSGNASALDITTSGATSKTIDINVQDSTFTNASATAAAANFMSTGTTTYNATIQGNSFDNATVGGDDFLMTATGAQSRILLNLGGTLSPDFNSANGQGSFELVQAGGSTFRLFERTDTNAGLRNNGTVNTTGTTTDSGTTTPPIPVPPTSP